MRKLSASLLVGLFAFSAGNLRAEDKASEIPEKLQADAKKQFAAKKLLDANVPNFGAVLNGLNLAVSGYYYAQYYDKSYKDYYVTMAKQDDAEEM